MSTLSIQPPDARRYLVTPLMTEAFAVTLVGVALAQASPGPNLLAVAGAALGQGRRAALLTVVGVATGMLVWAALVALGIGAVLAVFPSLMSAMKLLGGGYLLWLALRALRAGWHGHEPSIRADASGRGGWRSFLRGLFVVLTNPKALLMWSAVGTFLFGAGLNAWQVAAFGPVGALSGLTIYGSYALLFSTGLAARTYARFARVIEVGLGIAFGGLGGRLVLDGARELRERLA